MKPIITKADAKAQGLARYFTGRPCRRGHVVERHTEIGDCVECRRNYFRTYMAERRLKNPEKTKEERRNWRRRNPEKVKAGYRRYHAKHTEKIRARCREYRKANIEKLRARGRLYNQTNSETVKKRAEAWRLENPDRCLANRQKRRARKQGAVGQFSADDIREIRKLQRNRCAEPSCRRSLRGIKAHADHIMPLALGGSNERRNIQLLCPKCNRSKWATDPIDYAKRKGRLL